mgnify:CR=1 FL=1
MPSGVPIVVGDIGGVYTLPGTPPSFASFPMTGGVPNVLIKGAPVLTVAQGLTGGGPIVSSTLVSTKTLIGGSPVHLGGSVTNLGTGWIGGVLQATVAAGVLVG